MTESLGAGKTTMMKKTNGNDSYEGAGFDSCSLSLLFKKQIEFQKMITKNNAMPIDSTVWFSYHMQAMIEELGEVLRADKRWKTHRNEAYDPENKAEELSDVFITVLNLFIFSGIDENKLFSAVYDKIETNIKRMKLKGE